MIIYNATAATYASAPTCHVVFENRSYLKCDLEGMCKKAIKTCLRIEKKSRKLDYFVWSHVDLIAGAYNRFLVRPSVHPSARPPARQYMLHWTTGCMFRFFLQQLQSQYVYHELAVTTNQLSIWTCICTGIGLKKKLRRIKVSICWCGVCSCRLCSIATKDRKPISVWM